MTISAGTGRNADITAAKACVAGTRHRCGENESRKPGRERSEVECGVTEQTHTANGPHETNRQMKGQSPLMPDADQAASAQGRGNEGRPGVETGNEPFSLADYARLAQRRDLSAEAIYRGVVWNLPRCLHQRGAETQRQILSKAPPRTATPWDALIAAVAEHSAERHGHEIPPWTNERERFLDTPWHPVPQLNYRAWEAALYCPGAFTRHGTPIHPSDLDSRGGDEPWKPDGCEATTFLDDSEIFTS